jgi:signal transduction histidine kinase
VAERLGGDARMSFPQILRIGIFAGGSLLAAAVFLFTQSMIERLSREVESTSTVLARFCAQASFPATRDPQLMRIFSDLISGLDFPIVITDPTGTPRAWRQIDVDPALVPAESLDSLTQQLPVAPVIRDRVDRVRARAAELDRKNDPIAMTLPGARGSLGAVHYGDPAVLDRLRWMPLVSLGGVALLLGIGLWGLAIIRQAEKRTIWVGMAKETAHQLGTPISSLMGWTELLRGRAEGVRPGDDVRVPAEEFGETLAEIERDLVRLNKVAQRFSHVGSTPKLELQDPTPVVREVVSYMRRRVPQGPAEVVLAERYETVPPVLINPELIEWALENLITNALTALDKRPGRIEVAVTGNGRGIEIAVTDNGRGMTPAEQRRAFEPGYTTRRRGWGLGLPLARRVIEEYHRGRLFVRESTPGRGTTMVMSLGG